MNDSTNYDKDYLISVFVRYWKQISSTILFLCSLEYGVVVFVDN